MTNYLLTPTIILREALILLANQLQDQRIAQTPTKSSVPWQELSCNLVFNVDSLKLPLDDFVSLFLLSMAKGFADKIRGTETDYSSIIETYAFSPNDPGPYDLGNILYYHESYKGLHLRMITEYNIATDSYHVMFCMKFRWRRQASYNIYSDSFAFYYVPEQEITSDYTLNPDGTRSIPGLQPPEEPPKTRSRFQSIEIDWEEENK